MAFITFAIHYVQASLSLVMILCVHAFQLVLLSDDAKREKYSFAQMRSFQVVIESMCLGGIFGQVQRTLVNIK